MDVVDFLLSRLSADEDSAKRRCAQKALDECAYKRRHVGMCVEVINGPYSTHMKNWYRSILGNLASAYIDHPDYNPDWHARG